MSDQYNYNITTRRLTLLGLKVSFAAHYKCLLQFHHLNKINILFAIVVENRVSYTMCLFSGMCFQKQDKIFLLKS